MKPQPNRVAVLLKNRATGFEKRFPSLYAASKELGIDAKQLSQAAIRGRNSSCHGWEVTRLDEMLATG